MSKSIEQNVGNQSACSNLAKHLLVICLQKSQTGHTLRKNILGAITIRMCIHIYIYDYMCMHMGSMSYSISYGIYIYIYEYKHIHT